MDQVRHPLSCKTYPRLQELPREERLLFLAKEMLRRELQQEVKDQ